MENIVLTNNSLLNDKLIENLNNNHLLEKLDYDRIPDTVGIAFDRELSKFVFYMTDDRVNFVYSQTFNSFKECLSDARKAFYKLCAYRRCINKIHDQKDARISLFLINDMLFDDNIIKFYKESAFLTSLLFNNNSDTVGVFYKDDKFIAYRTNEHGRICVGKEFASFDKALSKAREMYNDLCYVMEIVNDSITKRKNRK